MDTDSYSVPVRSDDRVPELRKRCFGLFVRKERWALSFRGMILALGILACGAFLLFRGIYPFLAPTVPVSTDTLVVEGWVFQATMRQAAREFSQGGYHRVLVTGGPVSGMGGYSNDYNTSASVGAGNMRAAGVPADLVQMVPSRSATRDRTYGAAVALRDFLKTNNTPVNSVNIVTEGPHARRTRLLFSKALGPDVKVGIISVPHPDYDANRWWRYSEGVREVLGEAVAYVYARFLFSPSNSDTTTAPSPSPQPLSSGNLGI